MTLSPDGNWFWDGGQWIPAPPTDPPTNVAQSLQNPPPQVAVMAWPPMPTSPPLHPPVIRPSPNRHPTPRSPERQTKKSFKQRLIANLKNPILWIAAIVVGSTKYYLGVSAF